MVAMPKTWPREALGKVAHVVSGYAFKSSEFGERGIPVIKIKNVRVGHVALSDVEYVDEKYRSIPERYHVQAGDVLISLTGSHISQPNSVVGRVARHSASLPNCLLNQRVGKITSKDASNCDLGFLFYALSEQETVRAIAMKAHGAANQANVSPSQVESVLIPLPPLRIQRRIAGVLSAYDELIENSQRRIKILESAARALYREWFVHFRFPGHESVPRVPSPLGEIPKGWKVKPFTEIADVLSGGTPKTDVAEYWNGDIPFFTPRDAPDCFYLHDTDKHVTELGLSKCASALYPPDTVFITARGTVGKVSLPSVPMAMNQSCYALRGKVSIPQHFLFLMTLQQVDYLKTNTGGATFDTIVVDTFRRMEVVEPAPDIVFRFAEKVDAVFEQVNTLQRQSQNLRRTRDLLLPRLLSGQIDVEAIGS